MLVTNTVVFKGMLKYQKEKITLMLER